MGGSVLQVTGPYHQQYDPATGTWRGRAPVPRSLDHIGSAGVNGKIYLIGGFVGGGGAPGGGKTPVGKLSAPPPPGAPPPPESPPAPPRRPSRRTPPPP